jgi:hypothetical protein
VSALGTAAHVLGAIALVAAGVILGAVLRIFDIGIGTTAAVAMAVAVGAVAALLALLRSVVMPRLGRRDRREIRLAQLMLSILMVMIVAGAATAAIRAVDNLVAAAAIVGVAAGAAALVVQWLVRFDLAPRWMTTLLDVISDPRGLLTWAGARAQRRSTKS